MNHLKSWALRYVIGLIAACVALSFVIFQPTASATDLTTRATKGSALTYNELDANFDIGAQNKTASYPIAYTDNRDTIEFDGASLTATLPDVATVVGQADTGDFEVTLINLNSTALTVARTGTDTINGATSWTLPQYASATFKANNATDGWDVISGAEDIQNFNVAGNLTVAGNTTIGNASGDSLTFNPSAWTLSNAVTITGTGTWTNLGTVTTADINGGTIDGVTIGASSAPTVTNLGTVTTADINGGTIDGVTIGATAAPTVTNLGTVTTADINGGTIDGVTIGASVAPTVTNLGTVTTADINGGTVDNVCFGCTTPAAVHATTGAFSGLVTSTRACDRAGYTRVGPNTCVVDSGTYTALTRDACTAVALTGSETSLTVDIYAYARSENATGQRYTAVTVYGNNTCTQIKGQVYAWTYEQVATAGAVTLTLDHGSVTANPNSGSSIYIKQSDDAGDVGIGYYLITETHD